MSMVGMSVTNQILARAERRRLLGEREHVQGELDAVNRRLDGLNQEFKHMLGVAGLTSDQKHPSDVEHLAMFVADMRARGPEGERSADLAIDRLDAQYMSGHYDFLKSWKAAAYARLSCGHKLAAALMMTTASDDVRAPWAAWSLYVPNDLITCHVDPGPAKAQLGDGEIQDGRVFELPPVAPGTEGAIKVETCRIWCLGTQPYALVERFPRGCMAMKYGTDEGPSKEAPLWVCIRNYIHGVCLLLERERPESCHTGPWGPKSSKKRTGKEPHVGAEYQLGTPVSIDLRDAVREYLGGGRGKGRSPSVQFLVRGHWRNQACGPHRADRRRKWIEPFWKGPEETRVLLRGYAVKAEVLP